MSDPKQIDLDPRDYQQTAGPKRREPFFAPGWKYGLLALLSVLFVKALVLLAIR